MKALNYTICVRSSAIALTVYGLLAVTMAATPAAGVELTFTLEPSQSEVSAIGFIVPVQSETQPQGAGADITSYSGTLAVEVDDPFAPTTIQFLGGSVAAANSGDWLPEVGGGSPGIFLPGDADPGQPQPANYGITASGAGVGTLWVAFRNLALSPTSDALTVNAGAFAPEQMIEVTQGTSDYTVRSIIFGDHNSTIDLVGEVAANTAEQTGTYSVDGSVATLQFPIDLFVELEELDFGVGLFELTFPGSVTATADLGPIASADFDEDGDVDGHDLQDLLVGFGTSPNAMLALGDANFDGTVNRQDYGIWQDQAGIVAALSTATAVPEPSSLLLALLVTVAAVGRCCRQRSAA